MLEDEKNKNVDKQPEEQIQSAEEYVKAVNAIRENSVDKTKYEKLEKDYNVLVKAVADGKTVSLEDAQETNKVDPNELRKKIFNADESMTNAEYVENVLKLREAIIAEGGLDPFLPSGEKITPDVNDIKGAAKVAEGLQYCLDAARGEDGKVDPELFNAHFNKIVAADSPLLSSRLKSVSKRS